MVKFSDFVPERFKSSFEKGANNRANFYESDVWKKYSAAKLAMEKNSLEVPEAIEEYNINKYCKPFDDDVELRRVDDPKIVNSFNKQFDFCIIYEFKKGTGGYGIIGYKEEGYKRKLTVGASPKRRKK